MARTIGSLLAVLALSWVASGCGSGSTHGAPPPRAASLHLASARGRREPAPSTLELLTVPRAVVQPHFKGLESLTLTQKLTTMASRVSAFWAAVFRNSQIQLAPATVTVVDQPPASCGTQQIATTDPPRYCLADTSVYLPLTFLQTHVAPIGDAAIALVVSDLYGYHIESALGLGAGSNLSAAQQQKTDSCFSGLYFLELEAEGSLSSGDETAVNTLLAAKAGPPGSSGSGVSAADLTAAFNTGINAHYNLNACLPARSLVLSRATSTPVDLLTTPANATSWPQLHIGQWDYRVPPDHSYATTAANPSGIDITSTDGAHFGIGIVTGSPSLLTLDQISSYIFSTGSEDTPGTQAQITATEGPSTGSAGSQDELIAWTGTRQDGTPVTGLVELEDFGYGFISYVLDGPSASWSTDLPVLLAIKANTMYTPAGAQ